DAAEKEDAHLLRADEGPSSSRNKNPVGETSADVVVDDFRAKDVSENPDIDRERAENGERMIDSVSRRRRNSSMFLFQLNRDFKSSSRPTGAEDEAQAATDSGEQRGSAKSTHRKSKSDSLANVVAAMRLARPGSKSSPKAEEPSALLGFDAGGGGFGTSGGSRSNGKSRSPSGVGQLEDESGADRPGGRGSGESRASKRWGSMHLLIPPSTMLGTSTAESTSGKGSSSRPPSAPRKPTPKSERTSPIEEMGHIDLIGGSSRRKSALNASPEGIKVSNSLSNYSSGNNLSSSGVSASQGVGQPWEKAQSDSLGGHASRSTRSASIHVTPSASTASTSSGQARRQTVQQPMAPLASAGHQVLSQPGNEIRPGGALSLEQEQIGNSISTTNDHSGGDGASKSWLETTTAGSVVGSRKSIDIGQLEQAARLREER
ncbi:unnamed protein product, partial [Amoebophrya sp. A25]